MAPSLRSYLTFSSSPWLVAISAIVILLAIGLGYWNWRRSRYRRGVLTLELFRLTIIGLILFSLHQPEWIQEFRPVEKPQVVVLIDQSRSMETKDVSRPLGSEDDLISRSEAVASLASMDSWKGLQDRFDVKLEPFPSQTESGSSDLSGALRNALVAHPSVQAVILASDGDWNRGVPPIETAAEYRSSNVPIFAVPVGSESRLPDLEVTTLDLPTFGVVNKGIRVPFTIESSLPREHVAQVTMEFSDGKKEVKEVRLAPMSKTTDSIAWTPEAPGEFNVSIQVAGFPEERMRENNTLTAPISIREEKLKVLIVDTYPRWEYRYLRNALSRDTGVEVSCLLLHPHLEKVGGGNRDYIAEFPTKPEELAVYDVVFLGDIGIGEKQLTEDTCKMLRGLVEFQASGLVFLPGSYGLQQTLADSPLEPLIPVVPDSRYPEGVGATLAMHYELTETGRRSLLTKLADTDEDNRDVWATLPGFQWYASLVRSKAGAETLAVHQEVANEYGRLPLIVTRTFGAGKVLYMATDGAWRWRRGVEDKYHYRFWGQVVRWMAYQRNMAKGESIRFFYSPESPQVGQVLSLKANVMNDAGEPLASGRVTAKIESPSREGAVVQLQGGGADNWGLFEGTFAVEEPGLHKVRIAAPETSGILEAEFFVQGTAQEPIGRAAKPMVLEELAKVSRGSMVALEQLNSLTDLVLQVPDPPIAVKRWHIWAHPWIMGGIILLLTLFWTGRKWLGLL